MGKGGPGRKAGGVRRGAQRAAIAERHRREAEVRAVRDRAKLLSKFEHAEPDGLVLAHHSTHAEVLLESGERAFALIAPKVHKLFGVSVGDLVWTQDGATPDERVIACRAERGNEVRRKRGEEDKKGHVIAANVDRMAITAALLEPPLRTGALDRYLVLASVLGIEPMIVITKTDQAGRDSDLWALVEPYEDVCPVIATSAETGEGLDELAEALTDRITVFAGHSGVGKSSICLALELEDAPIAGDMSYAHGRVRGRHTTSVARLLELPFGGWVVDTPGVRAIGLIDLEKRDVEVHFPEILAFARGCEFADCLHLDEEGCAVIAAVEDGDIPYVRYEGYERLMASLDEDRRR